MEQKALLRFLILFLVFSYALSSLTIPQSGKMILLFPWIYVTTSVGVSFCSFDWMSRMIYVSQLTSSQVMKTHQAKNLWSRYPRLPSPPLLFLGSSCVCGMFCSKLVFYDAGFTWWEELRRSVGVRWGNKRQNGYWKQWLPANWTKPAPAITLRLLEEQ